MRPTFILKPFLSECLLRSHHVFYSSIAEHYFADCTALRGWERLCQHVATSRGEPCIISVLNETNSNLGARHHFSIILYLFAWLVAVALVIQRRRCDTAWCMEGKDMI